MCEKITNRYDVTKLNDSTNEAESERDNAAPSVGARHRLNVVLQTTTTTQTLLVSREISSPDQNASSDIGNDENSIALSNQVQSQKAGGFFKCIAAFVRAHPIVTAATVLGLAACAFSAFYYLQPSSVPEAIQPVVEGLQQEAPAAPAAAPAAAPVAQAVFTDIRAFLASFGA